MYINEVSKTANLTKKAIEYYVEQGLVFPEVLDNGYRRFNDDDVVRLKKIAVFRKIGLSTEDIQAVQNDEKGVVLQRIAVQRELGLQREKAKQVILDQLCSGKSFAEIETALHAVEQSKTVTDKLLEAFPGYYGRLICLHFAPFLNEPILTPVQQIAYDEIIDFLDEASTLTFPEEVRDFLNEGSQNISTEMILQMNEQMKKNVENPEQFLAENKEILTGYLEFRNSDEYQRSPVFKIQKILQSFQRTVGYYEVFIPAMKKLSDSYAKYCRELEIANEKLLSAYPEAARLYTPDE